jgi:hypothetical protein
MAKPTTKKDNKGQAMSAAKHARNAERKAAKTEPKSPVPDAEQRNRQDTQVTEDATTAAARKAAPAVVAAVADAIKSAAAEAPTGQPSGDGSFDNTPTPTQLTAEALKPLDPHGTEELKIVRTGNLPGQPTTTLKEEVKIVDSSVLSGDKEKDDNTLSVLARTQGINQYADGKVVGQDGAVIAGADDEIEIEGETPKIIEERVNP